MPRSATGAQERRTRSGTRAVSPRHPLHGIDTARVDALLPDVVRLLCTHGAAEPSPEPAWLTKKRANTRQGLNVCARTLVELLLPTGEARARLLAIGDLLDPPVADVPLTVLNAQETAVEGALNTAQLAYQGGRRDYAVLAEIEDECEVNLVLYRQMRDAAAAEKAGLTGTRRVA